MCGIAGIVRFDGEPVLENEVRAMCSMLVHRGPDEEGVVMSLSLTRDKRAWGSHGKSALATVFATACSRKKM